MSLPISNMVKNLLTLGFDLAADVVRVCSYTQNLNSVPYDPSTGAWFAGYPLTPAPTDFMDGHNTVEMKITSPGHNVWNGDQYEYRTSFLAGAGETEMDGGYIVNTNIQADTATRIWLPVPPANVTAMRLWRNIASNGVDFYLLASFTAPFPATYDDTETHTQFAARHAEPPVAPAVNTTAQAAQATTKTVTVNAIVTAYSEREVDGQTVRAGDEKAFIKASQFGSMVPNVDDTFSTGGATRSVVGKKLDPTGQLWELHVRRLAE